MSRGKHQRKRINSLEPANSSVRHKLTSLQDARPRHQRTASQSPPNNPHEPRSPRPLRSTRAGGGASLGAAPPKNTKNPKNRQSDVTPSTIQNYQQRKPAPQSALKACFSCRHPSRVGKQKRAKAPPCPTNYEHALRWANKRARNALHSRTDNAMRLSGGLPARAPVVCSLLPTDECCR